jgi:hypothetical protein
MDTNEPTGRASVALPGCMATVLLPRPPNFLNVKHGEGTMPLADVTAGDATLLGMAMARQLVAHWRHRSIEKIGMSPAEAIQFDAAPLLHQGVLVEVARKTTAAAGRSWSALSDSDQADLLVATRTIIESFLEEMNRE